MNKIKDLYGCFLAILTSAICIYDAVIVDCVWGYFTSLGGIFFVICITRPFIRESIFTFKEFPIHILAITAINSFIAFVVGGICSIGYEFNNLTITVGIIALITAWLESGYLLILNRKMSYYNIILLAIFIILTSLIVALLAIYWPILDSLVRFGMFTGIFLFIAGSIVSIIMSFKES